MHFIKLVWFLFFFSFCNACKMPSTLTASDVKVIDGDQCPPDTGAVPFKLFDPIKMEICDLPFVDDWAIVNGADCSLRGTGYGCQISQQQDPVAGQILCADCVTCPIPAKMTASDVIIADGRQCPNGAGPIPFSILSELKGSVCKLPYFDSKAIGNGDNCSLSGTALGCSLRHSLDPDAKLVLCANCSVCKMPTSATASDVSVVYGKTCPSSTRAITYSLLQSIKDDVCKLPKMGPYTIADGADCSLKGSSYGCLLSKGHESTAAHELCVNCAT